MTLRVDLGAIAHNLSLVQGIARAAGLNLAPVIKGAFACRPIVEAILSGGADTICISPTTETGWLPPIIQLEVLRLSLPEQASSIIRRANASVHTNLETVRAFGVAARTLGRNHGIWIGVRTSDDREGVSAKELLTQATSWRGSADDRLVIRGVLGQWGCRPHAQICHADIMGLIQLAEDFQRITGCTSMAASIGGSALLRLLPTLPKIEREVQFRVGEAILAGTIPGESADALGLQRAVTAEMRVIEVRAPVRYGEVRRPRALLDYGHTSVDPTDVEFDGLDARIVLISSEVMAIEVGPSAPLPRLGATLRARLGFKSALRALTNQNNACIFTKPAARLAS